MCRWVRVCAAMDEGVRAHEMWMCGMDGCQMACMCVGHASTLMGCWKEVQWAKKGVVPLILTTQELPVVVTS